MRLYLRDVVRGVAYLSYLVVCLEQMDDAARAAYIVDVEEAAFAHLLSGKSRVDVMHFIHESMNLNGVGDDDISTSCGNVIARWDAHSSSGGGITDSSATAGAAASGGISIAPGLTAAMAGAAASGGSPASDALAAAVAGAAAVASDVISIAPGLTAVMPGAAAGASDVISIAPGLAAVMPGAGALGGISATAALTSAMVGFGAGTSGAFTPSAGSLYPITGGAGAGASRYQASSSLLTALGHGSVSVGSGSLGGLGRVSIIPKVCDILPSSVYSLGGVSTGGLFGWMNDNLGLDFVAFCKSRGINLATDRDYLAFVDVWWVRVFIVFFEKKDSIPTQYVDSGLLSRLCIHLSERLVHCRVNVEEYKTWGVIYQVLKGADVSLFEFERQVAANPVSYSVVCDMVKDFKFCVFYTRSEIPEEEFDCAPVAV